MKKIFNVAFTLAFVLVAVSCAELLNPNFRNETDQLIPESAKVTLYFGIPAEVETKAPMASDPTIESIHVLVFNKEGILVEAAEAERFGAVTENGPLKAKHWAVTLMMAGEERRLHFIANMPKVLDNNGQPVIEDGKYVYDLPTAGSEASVFQILATSYPNAAYWQRRVLSIGIHAYQYDGSKTYDYVVKETGELKKGQDVPYDSNYGTNGFEAYQEGGETYYRYKDPHGQIVSKDDYLDRDGCKIVDGTGFYAIEEVVESVPLVRNFARIRVKSTWTNEANQTFTLTQAALVNKPAAGFIAPYDNVANTFVEEYTSLSGDETPDIADLAGYSVNVPGAGIDKSNPQSFETAKDNDGYILLFSYERNKPTSDPICLLVAGKWGPNAEEIWYKIELRDLNGDFFPVFRDISYDVNITGIESTGYSSSTDAWKAAAVGDVSNSPETATLEQIYDDRGLTLWVNYIDKAVLDADIDVEDEESYYVTLLYTCFREKTINNVLTRKYFNDLVSLSRQEYPESNLPYATEDPDSATPTGYPRAVTASDGITPPDSDLQWYITKIKLKKIGQDEQYLRSQIHVEAKVTAARNKFDDEQSGYDKTLSRDVTYTVMPQQDLTFTLKEGYYDANAANETRTVVIELPTTLTPSLFPLTLKIEANNNCLNPVSSLTTESGKMVGTLTTESGKSAFDPNRKQNSFYFLATIAYSDYYDAISKAYTTKFECQFKSIIAPGNAAQLAVSDKKGNFNTAFGPLVSPTFSLSATGLSVKASQTSASFDIRSNVGTWTVTADNGAEVVRTRANSTSGSGNASIAVSFPDNMAGTATKTYTVTVILDTKSKELYGLEDQTFTIEQNTPVPHMVKRTVTNSSFTLSNASSITDGGGKVNLTHGSGITYNNGNNANNRYFTYNGSSGFTFSFAPVSNDATVNITGITFNWNSSDYRPSGITLSSDDSSVGSISPGGSSTNGSWTGEQIIEVDKPLIATLTRRNNANSFRIYSISVSYTYQEQDGWE